MIFRPRPSLFVLLPIRMATQARFPCHLRVARAVWALFDPRGTLLHCTLTSRAFSWCTCRTGPAVFALGIMVSRFSAVFWTAVV